MGLKKGRSEKDKMGQKKAEQLLKLFFEYIIIMK